MRAHTGVNLADSLEPDDYDEDEDENDAMRGAGMGGDEDAFRSYMLDHAMMLDSADAHPNGIRSSFTTYACKYDFSLYMLLGLSHCTYSSLPVIDREA